MPEQFEGLGVKFLYPDNWKEVPRAQGETADTFVIESPGGAYFSITRIDVEVSALAVVEEACDALKAEYSDAEEEEIPEEAPDVFHDLEGIDLGFFYLDLLVTARIVAWPIESATIMVQMQAESREFDKQEQVFAAMLASMRGVLPG